MSAAIPPPAVPIVVVCPTTPESPPIHRLSDEFERDDKRCTCFDSVDSASIARTWEDQEEAISNRDCGTCCKLAVISRVKHAVAGVLWIPTNLGCMALSAACGAGLLACSVFRGVLGGLKCILCCSDRQCVVAEKCCILGTECLILSGCFGLFTLWDIIKCPGNVPCSELQSLAGQHRVDLCLSKNIRAYSQGIESFNEIL